MLHLRPLSQQRRWIVRSSRRVSDFVDGISSDHGRRACPPPTRTTKLGRGATGWQRATSAGQIRMLLCSRPASWLIACISPKGEEIKMRTCVQLLAFSAPKPRLSLQIVHLNI